MDKSKRKRVAITVNAKYHDDVMEFLRRSPAFELSFYGVLVDGFNLSLLTLLKDMEKDVLEKTERLTQKDANRYIRIMGKAMGLDVKK